jgi:CheY-like chemotaxis protein
MVICMSEQKSGGGTDSVSNSSQATPARTSLYVLVVDDDRDALLSLAELLKLSGHQVQTAHTGLGAVVATRDFNPDVVLLDIGLPEIDGYEAARRIRQLPEHKQTMLIAMSGFGQEADRQQSQKAGFDHHLVKPTDFGTVLEILATIKAK